MPRGEAARGRIRSPRHGAIGHMTNHLIIGGGPAAINAIETIRDFDGGPSQITLVSDEPAYARMVLPYWLANQIPEKQVYTGDDGYFANTLKVDRQIGQ